MVRIVLLRHGQSIANAADVFTGWSDPALTDLGRAQAAGAVRMLLDAGLVPTRIIASPLGRCVETVRILRETIAAPDLPVSLLGALRERDYGVLTGMNKAGAGARFGDDQVRLWCRSYKETPPEGESLRDTAARVLSCYISDILPAALAGGTTLIVAHGNSLRALAMTLDGLDAMAVESLDIPTGGAISYALDASTRVVSRSVIAPKDAA